MKHLLIYSLLMPVVLGFMIYKVIEAIINVLLSISDIEDKLHYQLNIFGLERTILKTIKKIGYRNAI